MQANDDIRMKPWPLPEGRGCLTGGTELDPHGIDAHAPGAKLDAGKVRVDLLLEDFPHALRAVAKVATAGAAKYTEHGWLKVPDGRRRYTGALGRHLLDEHCGELHDAGTGLPHAAHVAWNALARLELLLRPSEVLANQSSADPAASTCIFEVSSHNAKGRVWQAQSGQWRWIIAECGVEIQGGAGFGNESDATSALLEAWGDYLGRSQ